MAAVFRRDHEMPEPRDFPNNLPRLLAAGAALFADGTLVAGDLHLGKATVFRRSGIAVPEGGDATTLAVLGGLIDVHRATRLVVAGDFLHAPDGWSDGLREMWRAWRARHNVTIDLVPGNHDRRVADWAGAAGIATHPAGLDLHGWHITHHPPDAATSHPVIAAHLHPVARLAGGLGRAPCFWWRDSLKTLVLPAFGSFTGGYPAAPETGDWLWLARGDGDAIPLPVRALRKARGCR